VVVRWRGNEVVSKVARWCGDKVARWRGSEVVRWRNGKVAW